MLRGDRIKDLREGAGISQVRLGRAIGQDGPYISTLERGHRTNIMADTLDDIATILACSTDYLLGHTDNPKPQPPRGSTSEDGVEDADLPRPHLRAYLLTWDLDRIERLFGVPPGLVDPHEYDYRRAPRREEPVKGYWLAEVAYPIYEENRIGYAWNLWTGKEREERPQVQAGPVAVLLPGREYQDKDWRALCQDEAYALLRALSPQPTPHAGATTRVER